MAGGGTPDLDERLTRLCREAIGAEVFPGCAVGYVRGGTTKVMGFGRQTYHNAAPLVTADTVYDVASVTKSIPTAMAALKLVEEGRLSLDDRVGQYLPQMAHPDRRGVLVRHLLTYTVVLDLAEGLSAVAKRDPERLLDVILNAPLKAPPGELYRYTNSPAVLLGLVVERVAGGPLDELARSWFFEPLGMTSTTFRPKPAALGRTAPTELSEYGEVRGVPHDETAAVLLTQDMIAGCAGLFSTAGDLLRLAEMMLAGGALAGHRYFNPQTIELMATNQLTDIGQAAGLGWEIDRPDVMGGAQRPGRLMKSGFTGCWIAIDPGASSALVLLSNRTYPQRPERGPFQAFLRGLNEAFFLA
ncbi:MAG TPA: serine hydrolase domain-containing protein [Candidatus Saccharimonadia bacterium]|nr:serine hydrolase domain-containing protein [Candidatus Saccharimonadia bacterium]